ncbi:MAG: formylmethanofuran dehydrogenase subunit [Acetobacteraceae bacterium]|nr:formylmethanofuran dehydrogenase subunit [Acetobacteraceae bacterium]
MIETAERALVGCVASVDGKPVSPMEAIHEAATLLANSRSAVVAGLGTDVAGAQASIALAQAIGASIDHMDAGAVFANLDVMRRAGWIVTTPLQTRTRADTVLLVGDGLLEAWPEMADRLGLDAPPTLTGGERRVFRLSSGTVPPVGAATILPTLAALRALVAGRATSLDEAAVRPLKDLAAALTEARFGVAIWSGAELETLAIEMLCGLVDDLNRKTRFAGLPLLPPNGAEGVTQAAAWATGFPVRTGFAGSGPLHDPWRFDARRLIASGEADVAIWISAFSSTPPPWDDAVPTIALVASGTAFGTSPAVVFEVGCPGRDHDAMLFDPALGGIAFAAASARRTVPSVADTVAAIAAALPQC